MRLGLHLMLDGRDRLKPIPPHHRPLFQPAPDSEIPGILLRRFADQVVRLVLSADVPKHLRACRLQRCGDHGIDRGLQCLDRGCKVTRVQEKSRSPNVNGFSVGVDRFGAIQRRVSFAELFSRTE